MSVWGPRIFIFGIFSMAVGTLVAIPILIEPGRKGWEIAGQLLQIFGGMAVGCAFLHRTQVCRQARLRASGIRIDASVTRFSENIAEDSVYVEVWFIAPDGKRREGGRGWPGDELLRSVVPIRFLASQQGSKEDWDFETKLFRGVERPIDLDLEGK